jgi:hypothetical protein
VQIKIDRAPRQTGHRGRSGERDSNTMRGVVLIAFAAALFLILSGCERWALDKQMEELCKKDGGVKVYEQVKVPTGWLDVAGRPNLKVFPTRDVGGGMSRQVLADQYVIETRRQDIKRASNDDPGFYTEGRLSRYAIVVRRVADNKTLGEEVSYGRSGGDLSLGHPSYRSCPDPRPIPDVIQSVFVKE